MFGCCWATYLSHLFGSFLPTLVEVEEMEHNSPHRSAHENNCGSLGQVGYNGCDIRWKLKSSYLPVVNLGDDIQYRSHDRYDFHPLYIRFPFEA